MNKILIEAIISYGTQAIKRGYDFPSDFFTNAESYTTEELIEFYGDLRDFIGYERGFADRARYDANPAAFFQ